MKYSIGWIKIDNSDDRYKFGGSIYNERSRAILQRHFQLRVFPVRVPITPKRSYLQLPNLLNQLRKLKGSQDVWIRDFYSATTRMFDKTKGKNIVLIHHIDTTTLSPRLRPLFRLYEVLFYLSLRRADAIVTMSRFWTDHFRLMGFDNVYTVYNPIDFKQRTITTGDIIRFKKKYGLGTKPIVYLGNCRPYKGVREAYEALKDLDVQLITSGHKQVDLPIPNLVLDHTEQLILQKASHVAIAMSRFKEGWSMTVHEAMSVGTPVVGSGMGGMIELLRGGKQIVCRDFKDLSKHVSYLLKHKNVRIRMGRDGKKFALLFTKERFEREWVNVIQYVMDKGRSL